MATVAHLAGTTIPVADTSGLKASSLTGSGMAVDPAPAQPERDRLRRTIKDRMVKKYFRMDLLLF
jgi:hypothetical protein